MQNGPNLSQQSYAIGKMGNIIPRSIIRFPDARYMKSPILSAQHCKHQGMNCDRVQVPTPQGQRKNSNQQPWRFLKVTSK